MKIKQSLCYQLYRPPALSLDDYLAEVARLGFAAIELWGRDEQFPELMRLANHHRLAVASMIGHMSLTEGMNNPAEHDRIQDELRVSLELAAQHRIGGLICFSGNRRPGQPEADAIAATDYPGYVGHEFTPKADPLAVLRAAFALCDQSNR